MAIGPTAIVAPVRVRGEHRRAADRGPALDRGRHVRPTRPAPRRRPGVAAFLGRRERATGAIGRRTPPPRDQARARASARFAHEPAQSVGVRTSGQRGHRPGVERPALCAALRRPGRLQAGQRHVRPRSRRRLAASSRGTSGRRGPAARPRLSPRRRRVRDLPRPRRPPR